MGRYTLSPAVVRRIRLDARRQQALARLAGLHPSTLSRFLSGYFPVTEQAMPAVRHLAELVGADPERAVVRLREGRPARTAGGREAAATEQNAPGGAGERNRAGAREGTRP